LPAAQATNAALRLPLGACKIYCGTLSPHASNEQHGEARAALRAYFGARRANRLVQL
jgi:hypothetical protein